MSKPLVSLFFCISFWTGTCQSYGQGRSGVGSMYGSPQPGFYPIPVQSYAAIDISNTNVDLMALDDNNKAAFSYHETSATGMNIVVKTWQNGSLSPDPVQTIPMHAVLSSATDGRPLDDRYIYFYDGPLANLRSNGDFLSYSYHFYHIFGSGNNPPPDGYKSNGETNLGFISSGGNVSEFGQPIPPYPQPQDPVHPSATITSISPTGYGAEAAGYLLHVGSPLYSGTTVFDPSPDAPASTSDVKIVNEAFKVSGGFSNISATGWAIGHESGRPVVWNTIKTDTLPNDGVAINDSNDILISNSDNGSQFYNADAGLIIAGAAFRPFLDGAYGEGLIPKLYQKQLRNVGGSHISNCIATSGSTVQLVSYTRFLAQNQPSIDDKDPALWPINAFILCRYSDGSTDLHKISNPDGLGPCNYISLNTSGIIAAIGSKNNISTEKHALLLIPITFRLLNGDQSGIDGMDFDRNRPAKISETSNYVTSAVINADIGNPLNLGNAGLDTLGVDRPLGQGRPLNNGVGDDRFYGNAYLDSLMLLAQVCPPLFKFITYKWNRTFQINGVAITHTATAGHFCWYVRSVGYDSGDNPDYYGAMARYETVIPSADKSVICIWDDPGMYIPKYSSYAPKKGDYAYQKIVFTYTLTISTGSTSSDLRPKVSLRTIAIRKDTTGITGTDWMEGSNISSTRDIPDCDGFTIDEIRAIVGGTDPIVFDSQVKH